MALVKSGRGKVNGVVNRRIRELTKELEKLTRAEGERYYEVDEADQAPLDVSNNCLSIKKIEDRVDRLLRLKEVLALLPISKSTFYAGIKSGRYPAPVKHLGPRIAAWRFSEIVQLVKGEGTSHE